MLYFVKNNLYFDSTNELGAWKTIVFIDSTAADNSETIIFKAPERADNSQTFIFVVGEVLILRGSRGERDCDMWSCKGDCSESSKILTSKCHAQ